MTGDPPGQPADGPSIPQDLQLQNAQLLQPFRALALTGLPRMWDDVQGQYCFRAVRQGQDLGVEGHSPRYGAMVAIGAAAQAALGTPVELNDQGLLDTLVAAAPRSPVLGDAGLVLLALCLRQDPRSTALGEAILARRDEVLDPGHDLPSMETGFVLMGLAAALRQDLAPAGCRDFAAALADQLRGNQDSESGLFHFSRRLPRKNLHRARLDGHLGSFASQVYPILGLGSLALALDDEQLRASALAAAAAVCRHQGPSGEWWWIYHPGRDRVALRHPVYTVHQDAMGPLAMSQALELGAPAETFAAASKRSLQWFGQATQATGLELCDPRQGMVWRALQHDHPARTERLGLGPGERLRMARAAWLGTADQRTLRRPQLCPECRPYHLGWVLWAEAWVRQNRAPGL